MGRDVETIWLKTKRKFLMISIKILPQFINEKVNTSGKKTFETTLETKIYLIVFALGKFFHKRSLY